VCGESHPEFESLPLRHFQELLIAETYLPASQCGVLLHADYPNEEQQELKY
jgi:hypothetical protein